MMKKETIKMLVDYAKEQGLVFSHNKELFTIYEGDLLSYIDAALKAQFTEKAYKRIRPRLAPINVLKKIIDKLSKIYQQSPVRTVEGGGKSDAKLVSWYEKEMGMNQKMNISNEFFNMFKNTAVQPYVDPKTQKPKLRAIPSHLFTVYSDDPVDPTVPTYFILCAGHCTDAYGARKAVYHIYSDTEFVIVDEDANILTDRMAKIQNPEGINPYGKIPFVYVNRSTNCLIPIPDTDTLAMTKIIPILISDLNYAVMYQAFSIIYGINVEDKNLEMNPSAFWSLKSDPTVNQKPELGVIKPQVDISSVLELVKAEMAFWLETKGLKTSSVGSLDSGNAASGLSKIIDELDTTEERMKQVEFFTVAEFQLWELILKHMHPVWSANGIIENRTLFTPTATVNTQFKEQVPMVRRGELVTSLDNEVKARFTSRERAIKTLNPELTDKQVEELMEEIDEERTIEIVDPSMDNGGMNDVNGEANGRVPDTENNT